MPFEENTIDLLQSEKNGVYNNNQTVNRKRTISPLRRLTPQVKYACKIEKCTQNYTEKSQFFSRLLLQ